MLAPLTRLTYIKRKFEWAQSEQYAFVKIKQIVAHNNLLTYQYFNETFKIHTNASTFQLGVVITQKRKIITVYSRKLTGAQKRYTVIYKELLSILET